MHSLSPPCRVRRQRGVRDLRQILRRAVAHAGRQGSTLCSAGEGSTRPVWFRAQPTNVSIWRAMLNYASGVSETGRGRGHLPPKTAQLSPELRSRYQEGRFSGSAPFPRLCGLGAPTSFGASCQRLAGGHRGGVCRPGHTDRNEERTFGEPNKV